MGVSIASQLQDVADSIDRLSDEIRHEEHDEGRLDRLQDCVVVLTQSIDDLAGAIRYATNNLLDDRYHPQVATTVATAVGREPTDDEQIASEEGTAAVVTNPSVNESSDSQPEPLAEIPVAVQERVRGLVESLQQWGEQHASVAAYGAVTEMQWWENVGEQILGCNRRLQELRELAASNSADIQPIVDGVGGVPESMLIDDVPDLAGEPAFSEPIAGGRQQHLFDAADLCAVPQVNSGPEPSTNGQSVSNHVEAIQSSTIGHRTKLADLLSDKTLTAGDRRLLVIEQTQSALADLEQALNAGKSTSLVEYLEVLSRFHNYSMRNIMLIAMQAPGAIHVAGFNAWKKLGRTVKKGEKGIRILAPIAYRNHASSDDNRDAVDDEESPKSVLAGFKVVSVFDVSQTEGKELPELAEITGEPGKYLDQLESLVRSKGIELSYEEIPGGILGLSKGGSIAIQQGLPKPERFSVLIHELAHLCGEHSYVAVANLSLAFRSLSLIEDHITKVPSGKNLRV